MNDLLNPRTTSTTAAPRLSVRREPQLQRPLVIGAYEMAPKDHLLLHSLVRLLDGRDGRRLNFAEAVTDCNVVFVGAPSAFRLSGGLTVRVVGDSPPAIDAAAPSGLSIAPPLRLTNVSAVLHLVGQLVDNQNALSEGGLLALFNELSHLLLSRERRLTVLPLHDGRQLTVDIASERLHATLVLDELLTGAYRIGDSRRASIDDRVVFDAGPLLSLRALVWRSARRLAESGISGPPLRGSYRMLRWPDAVALAWPGVPRLAALLTSRAMSIEQAHAESDLGEEAIVWLLHAGLALGVVALAEEQAVAPNTVVAAAPQSLIGRLRERLKLW